MKNTVLLALLISIISIINSQAQSSGEQEYVVTKVAVFQSSGTLNLWVYCIPFPANGTGESFMEYHCSDTNLAGQGILKSYQASALAALNSDKHIILMWANSARATINGIKVLQ